jgi:hypothetical protein
MHSLIHVNIQKKKISHLKEKQVKEKEAIYLPKAQEGKKETIQKLILKESSISTVASFSFMMLISSSFSTCSFLPSICLIFFLFCVNYFFFHLLGITILLDYSKHMEPYVKKSLKIVMHCLIHVDIQKKKYLTTSQCPRFDAANNCDCPRLLRKLISAPELSKHLTTSHRPKYDATNNGDRPCLLGKLISAPELSKHLTIAQCPCL